MQFGWNIGLAFGDVRIFYSSMAVIRSVLGFNKHWFLTIRRQRYCIRDVRHEMRNRCRFAIALQLVRSPHPWVVRSFVGDPWKWYSRPERQACSCSRVRLVIMHANDGRRVETFRGVLYAQTAGLIGGPRDGVGSRMLRGGGANCFRVVANVHRVGRWSIPVTPATRPLSAAR